MLIRSILISAIFFTFLGNVLSQKVRSLSELHEFLHDSELNQRDQVEAYVDWITSNIRYDSYEYRKIAAGQVSQIQDAQTVAKSRKAVCEGYSNLLRELCKRSNIKCHVVVGYARGNSYKLFGRNEEKHAWNAVEIDGQWHLLDLTWASGHLDQNYNFNFDRKDEYLFVASNIMIKDHYPFDPIWQLSSKPLTLKDFRDEVNIGNPPKWNYTDSVNTHLNLSEQEALFAEKERILRYDPTNGYARADLGYQYISSGYKILTLQQDRIKKAKRDRSLLKNEKKYYNELDKAERLITQADEAIKGIKFNGDDNLKKYISETKASCKEAFSFIKKQRKWLKKYFKNPRPIR